MATKLNGHVKQRTTQQTMPVWTMLRDSKAQSDTVTLEASGRPHTSKSSMVNRAIHSYHAFQSSALATGGHKLLQLMAGHDIRHHEGGEHVVFSKGHATIKVSKDGRTTIELGSESPTQMEIIRLAASKMQTGVW